MTTVHLVGVPLDLGAGRRGVDMGPTALRLAGLVPALESLGLRVEDEGNVAVPQREQVSLGDPRLRYLEAIAAVCRRLHAAVSEVCEAGAVPLVLGGDHALAVGSIAAVADDARRRGEKLGVVWLDAHADMNDRASSPSGNVHGMPLAALLGRGHPQLTGIGAESPAVQPERVGLVGLRALDRAEAKLVRDSGVWAKTMRDVDSRGLHACVEEVLDGLADCDRLHVSFDVDYLDAALAPGVGTPVRGGPDYREAHLTMELLADTGLVRSVDVVELNPILDERNRTAELAVELLQSLFGKRIL